MGEDREEGLGYPTRDLAGTCPSPVTGPSCARRSGRRWASLGLVVPLSLVSCGSRAPANVPAPDTHPHECAGVVEPPHDEWRPIPGAVAAPSLASGQPCGDMGCRIFDSPASAFAKVIESSPRILGIGEAHALSGTEGIEPATRRFTRDLLPLLRNKATDLVVELLVPNKSCQKETARAKEKQKVVTEKQASTDQSDYVVLANQARALGIRPHALEPTCEDLSRIASAGDDAVSVSLDVVTRLSRETAQRLYDKNAAAGDLRMVVAYGGAMHNDLTPRSGRERWSYGPAFAASTEGHYVEVDLIVPEFISDSPAWKSLPWTQSYDPNAHPGSTTLLSPENGSYVLVFPRTLAPGAQLEKQPAAPAP